MDSSKIKTDHLSDIHHAENGAIKLISILSETSGGKTRKQPHRKTGNNSKKTISKTIEAI